MMRRFPVALIATLLVLLIAPSFGSESSDATAQSEAALAIDLPAMALTTTDMGISTAGSGITLATHFVDYSFDLQRVATTFIEKEKTEQAFQNDGFIRTYTSSAGIFGTASGPNAAPVQEIVSLITQWKDEAGARSGQSLLVDPRAEPLPDPPNVGTGAVWTRSEGTDSVSGRPYTRIELVFRVADLTGRVFFAEFAVEPDLAQVAALGERAAARMTAVRSGHAVGLSALPVLLDRAQTNVGYPGERYLLYDGNVNRLYDETNDAFQIRAASYGNATEVYEVWQWLYDPADLATRAFTYDLELLRFPDDTGAHDYLISLPDIQSRGSDVTGVQQQPLEEALGNEGFTLNITTSAFGAEHLETVLVFRSGSTVAIIRMTPLGGHAAAPLTVLQSIGAAQASCLAAVQCSKSIPVPGALFPLSRLH